MTWPWKSKSVIEFMAKICKDHDFGRDSFHQQFQWAIFQMVGLTSNCWDLNLFEALYFLLYTVVNRH